MMQYNVTIQQLTKILSPPKRNETAMAAPSPRVLETDTISPRVDENNNNNSNQPPRVVDTKITTTLDWVRNRLRTYLVRKQSQNESATKPFHNSGRSRPERTKSAETDASAPRVDENNNNNNNNNNHPPRVIDTTTTTTTTTAIDRLRNRVRTNPVRNQSQNELTFKSAKNGGWYRQ
jgi:hypothetical protein